jgi:hypothetical protein
VRLNRSQFLTATLATVYYLDDRGQYNSSEGVSTAMEVVRDSQAKKDQCEGGESGFQGAHGRTHVEGEQDRSGKRAVAAGAQA